MADRMYPTPIGDLMEWVFGELETRRSVFGVPERVFFRPWPGDPFTCQHHGRLLQSPLGVAAGPHTQLVQNIVTAYLTGARFIELKTVQTLDELDVAKPCIDMEDVGYNCEWSQELRLPQSLDEYLKAWILIHSLNRHLGWAPPEGDGFLFNMSVGYNLEGIHKRNVQRFLESMSNAAVRRRELVAEAARRMPAVADVPMADRLAESITLSTMHGCPPDEIERIGLYLIEELGIHTAIKLNPTLLGPAQLREILHGELGFDDIEVPDQAFDHDPTFSDAVSIIGSLAAAAKKRGVFFWVKVTNTLETRNLRKVLPEREEMHYMSGRALHPLAVQLAANLAEAFEGRLPLSLSGGSDAFNLSDVIAGGLSPVTVCSDVLRPGGYGRLSQYLERLTADMNSAGAASRFGYICRTALADSSRKKALLKTIARRTKSRLKVALSPAQERSLRLALGPKSKVPIRDRLLESAGKMALGEMKERFLQLIEESAAELNLASYAKVARESERYRKPRRRVPFKTGRSLQTFDCVAAPCRDGCPANQNIPDYMYLVTRGRIDEAMQVVMHSNPLPSITGTVCDHPCMNKCVRSHYDQPLAIREIKRFITEKAKERSKPANPEARGISVGIVGAGPAGLTAAYYLALEGFQVKVYDAGPGPGGVPAQVIPSYRLPDGTLASDIDPIRSLGVEFQFDTRIGHDLGFEQLRRENRYVFIGVGAQQGVRLRVEGEDADGVFDCLDFLGDTRYACGFELGKQVLVIGGGNSAMDAARTAWRLVGQGGQVTLVYRRTEEQMPANDEELEALRAEGVQVRELLAPKKVVVDAANQVTGLECVEMELGPADDSGRPRPVAVDGSEFVLPANAILVAVGQRTEEDFLKKAGLALTKWGTVVVEDSTLETSLPGVYAGGDVVRGGGSIIQAAADARRVVHEILKREGLSSVDEPVLEKEGSPAEFLARKSRRVYPQPVPELPVDKRRNYEQVGFGMTAEQARLEARRCLDCDEFCGLCVTVCPNRANHYYASEPFEVQLDSYVVDGTNLTSTGSRPFRVEQASQIVNLADWCNECGNCETFCPTQGAPYRDKPRLCFSSASFDAEERAYRLENKVDGWRMEFKEPSGLHELELAGDQLNYRSPKLLARLAADDFTVRRMERGLGVVQGDRVDLRVCASLFVLAKGLTVDSSFLPQLGNVR